MAQARASIDRTVSAIAWAGFPALAESVDKWADLVGDEGADLVVSAVPLGMQFVAVRVTRTERGGRPEDWTEWLAPISFAAASQAAIDHFATRSLEHAANILRRRGIGPSVSRDLPSPEPVPPESTDPRGVPMARKSTKPPEAPAEPTPKAAKPRKAASEQAAAPPPEAKSAKPRKAAAKKSATTRRKADPGKQPVYETRSAEPTAPVATPAAKATRYKSGKLAPKGRGSKPKSAR